MRKKLKSFVSIILILMMLSGCAHSSNVQQGRYLSESEMKLGAQINQQIIQSMQVVEDAQINEIINKIGLPIAQFAKRKNIVYRFVVLKDDRIYATNAPGGYIYITTGMIQLSKDVNELAAALAYEIASAQYQDPRLSPIKNFINFLVNMGALVAPAFGSIGSLATLGFVGINKVNERKKSLDVRVKDADKKAVQYLKMSGFQPAALLSLLKKINDPENPKRAFLYDYLQSHPVGSERINHISSLVS